MPLLDIRFPAEVVEACKTFKGVAQKVDGLLNGTVEMAWWDGFRTGAFGVGLVFLLVVVVNLKGSFSMNRNFALGFIAFMIFCGYLVSEASPSPRTCDCAYRPEACTCPDACTCKAWKAKAFESIVPVSAASVGGFTAPNGKEIQCHLDERFHLKNRGGSDGAGLCVFASLKHGSIFQHVRQTEDIFEFMFTRPGGGYPSKVDKIISLLCESKKVELPDYLQIESRDLEILKLACKTGRMPGVTYGFSPTGRYNGQRIAHMVSLCHADDDWFGILDNNYPRSIEWMDPNTFLRVYTSGGGNGWSVIFLDPGPPPAPTN